METQQLNTEIPPPRLPLTREERMAEALRIFEETGVDVLREYPGIFDLEIVNAVNFPHESLAGAYESGCAEPWTSQLVTSLLIASNQREVLEIGGFTGQTSAWLACALERLGGGSLTVVDIEPDRCRMIEERLAGLGLTSVTARVVQADSLRYIPTLEKQSVGFAWIDGNHEHFHVASEITALYPKMRKGGIMALHDVYGSCDLQREVTRFGGYALDLPRLGAAGGLGIIQCR